MPEVVTPSSTRKTIVVVEAVFGGIGGTLLVLTLACCYKRWRARRRRCNEEDPAMVEEKAHSSSSDLMTTDRHRRNESQRTLQASITRIPKIEKLKDASDENITSSYPWPQMPPSHSLSQRPRVDSGIAVVSGPRTERTKTITRSTTSSIPAVSDTPGVVLRDSKSTLEESVEGNEACGHGRNDQIPENEQPSPSDRRRKNAIQPREVYEHPMSMVLSSSNLHFLYSEGGRNGPSSHLSESGGLQPEPSRVSKVASNADVEEVSDSNDSFVEAGDCEVETEEREIVVSSPAEAEETGHGAIISVGEYLLVQNPSMQSYICVSFRSGDIVSNPTGSLL
ncbi:hypothetical protein PM082_024808 [Marasmius tenuissimus]|nr:hypothetical protein PM082_024808 [Marasmius tenuissimus]